MPLFVLREQHPHTNTCERAKGFRSTQFLAPQCHLSFFLLPPSFHQICLHPTDFFSLPYEFFFSFWEEFFSHHQFFFCVCVSECERDATMRIQLWLKKIKKEFLLRVCVCVCVCLERSKELFFSVFLWNKKNYYWEKWVRKKLGFFDNFWLLILKIKMKKKTVKIFNEKILWVYFEIHS